MLPPEDINDQVKHDYHIIKDTNQVNNINNKKSELSEESPILVENTKRNEETLRKLMIVSVICLIFMIIEVIGGYLANSLAIMSDAAHLLSDLLGFIISIVSIYISRRGATHQMSFGYHRAEVIGALVSITLIWGLTIWLLYEATYRIIHRSEVDGLIMLITAIIGFVFNIVMGIVLAYEGIDHNLHHHGHGDDGHGHSHGGESNNQKKKLDEHGHSHEEGEHSHDHNHDHDKDHNHDNDKDHNHDDDKDHNHDDDKDHNHDNDKDHNHDNDKDHNHDDHYHDHPDPNPQANNKNHDNVNLRAALIHVIGDAVQNLGVIIAGVIIYIWPHASIADPICTFIFSIIVGFTTIRILKECISVLMEGSPLEFDMKQLEKDLKRVKGVIAIHDLHVWSLSVGKLSLSCHLTSDNPQMSLKKARLLIRNKYKISHSTIQVELESEENEDCAHDLHHEVQKA